MQHVVAAAAFALLTVSVSAFPQRATPLGHEGCRGRPLAAVLRVTLFNASELPDVAREMFLTETQRIWAREGVRIDWSLARTGSIPAPTPHLRVRLVREGLQGALPSSGPYTLADFRLAEATVYASAAGAQRVVDVGFEHPFDRLALAQLRLQTLGVVLGRAVAHEIGHYLLGREHARAGLMRSTFDPREFVDVRDRIFQLDHVDASRLTDALHDYLVRDLVDPIAPVADCGWP